MESTRGSTRTAGVGRVAHCRHPLCFLTHPGPSSHEPFQTPGLHPENPGLRKANRTDSHYSSLPVLGTEAQLGTYSLPYKKRVPDKDPVPGPVPLHPSPQALPSPRTRDLNANKAAPGVWRSSACGRPLSVQNPGAGRAGGLGCDRPRHSPYIPGHPRPCLRRLPPGSGWIPRRAPFADPPAQRRPHPQLLPGRGKTSSQRL